VRILITGAAGFIGGHLTREVKAHGHEVIPVDARIDPLLHDCRRAENVERLLFDHRPDVVVHLAARVGRLFGEDDLAETISDNAGMTAIVARACGDAGIPLAYASTSEVYGDCGDVIAYESITPRLPHNTYGLSKRHGEEFCRLYAPEGLLILRFSMPFGPGLPYGRGRAAIVNFLHQALTGQPIPVHEGSERSWCYVGDTVRAVRLLLEGGQFGAFNVGRDDNPLPLRRVAEMACWLTGADAGLIEDVPAPSRQTVVKRLATEKLRGIGWEPEVDLEEGMGLTLDWVRAQMAQERVAA
jgi:UDP-glucuronate decarboxylase